MLLLSATRGHRHPNKGAERKKQNKKKSGGQSGEYFYNFWSPGHIFSRLGRPGECISAALVRYKQFLKAQREEKDQDQKQVKRALITEEIDTLKKNRKKEEDDARHLTIEADSLCLDAQQQSSLILLARANTLRLTSKEKLCTVARLGGQIEMKEKELKLL